MHLSTVDLEKENVLHFSFKTYRDLFWHRVFPKIELPDLPELKVNWVPSGDIVPSPAVMNESMLKSYIDVVQGQILFCFWLLSVGKYLMLCSWRKRNNTPVCLGFYPSFFFFSHHTPLLSFRHYAIVYSILSCYITVPLSKWRLSFKMRYPVSR